MARGSFQAAKTTAQGLLFAACFAACQGDSPPPRSHTRVVVGPLEGSPVVAMGTGAMTPLAHALAEAYLQSEHGNVVVEDSVGSGGGVRAVVDGAIDIGLLSRPLTERERGERLVVTPIARSAVVLGAHPRVQVDGIASHELVALVRGDRTTFADGRPAVMLLRDRDESANAALELQVPALFAAREAAYASNRLRVLYYDEAMLEAITSTPGAIGLIDLAIASSARVPLKVLALDGTLPGRDDIAAGRWRASRELSFVYRRERTARVAGFLAFVRSPRGRAVIDALHAVPLPTTPADVEP